MPKPGSTYCCSGNLAETTLAETETGKKVMFEAVNFRRRNRSRSRNSVGHYTASNLEHIANLLCADQLSLLPSAGRGISSSLFAVGEGLVWLIGAMCLLAAPWV